MIKYNRGSASFEPFFLLLAIIIALWVLGGGPQKATTGNGTYVAPKTLSGIKSEVNRIDRETQNYKASLNKNDLIGILSPLSKYFTLQAYSYGTGNPEQEIIELTVSDELPQEMNITGFKLISGVSGASAIIGTAVYLPDPRLFVPSESVHVSPGDRIYIVSGKSPAGYSFKVNKCSGYFAQSHQYNPPLYTSCPRLTELPMSAVDVNFRNACINYMNGIGSCQIPKIDASTALQIGSQCAGYISNNTGYDTCIDKHKNDLDFNQHQWRIFLNQPRPLWQSQYEFIKLVDGLGRTVAYTSY